MSHEPYDDAMARMVAAHDDARTYERAAEHHAQTATERRDAVASRAVGPYRLARRCSFLMWIEVAWVAANAARRAAIAAGTAMARQHAHDAQAAAEEAQTALTEWLRGHGRDGGMSDAYDRLVDDETTADERLALARELAAKGADCHIGSDDCTGAADAVFRLLMPYGNAPEFHPGCGPCLESEDLEPVPEDMTAEQASVDGPIDDSGRWQRRLAWQAGEVAQAPRRDPILGRAARAAGPAGGVGLGDALKRAEEATR